MGRFQPYHLGHHNLIKEIAESAGEIIIGIGSAQVSHDPDNPFTAGERMSMITRSLVKDIDTVFYVIPLEDLRRNAVWAHHVTSMSPPFNVVYSNNPLIARLFHEAGFRVERSPLFQRSEYSGREIRRRMISGEDWESLVPEETVRVIHEVKGVERILELAETDYLE